MEKFLPGFIKSADTSRDNNGKQDPDNINPDMPPLLSKKDKELWEWIEFIVFENEPLSIVESPRWRKHLKHENKFSIKTIRDVLLALTEPVENSLKAEMKATGHGFIDHNG